MMDKPPEESIAGPSPEALLALRLIPKVGDALAQYAIDRQERRLARASQVIEVAAEATRRDPEEFVKRICQDERLSDLLNEAVQAAARSGLENKRRALGKVLARASEGDDAAVDGAEMLLTSLAHLEPLHVRLMAKMLRRMSGGYVFSNKIEPRSLKHDNIDPSVGEAALLQLQAWGLVTSNIDLKRVLDRYGSDRHLFSMDYEPRYELTDHGFELLELLEVPEHHDDEARPGEGSE